jgi:hypothetical protein
MDVRPATRSDHGPIAATLAAAFATDPPLWRMWREPRPG